VDTVEVDLNVEELFAAAVSTDRQAVFIRGLETLSTLYGPGGLGLIYDFSVSHSYVAVAVGEEL